jgi:transposase
MYQAYKFRIYPTANQQMYLTGIFGCCWWSLNYSLKKHGRQSISYLQVYRFFLNSKTCNNCFHQVSEILLEVRHWNCLNAKAAMIETSKWLSILAKKAYGFWR